MSYIFQRVKILSVNSDIFDNEPTILSSDIQNEPLIINGFNYIIHEIKNELDNENYQKKLKNNIKFKYLNNPFEHNIQVKHKDFSDINSTIIKIYGIKEKIVSRSFFKMWEMLNIFDLINISNKNFKSFHIAEAPGGFVQACIIYNKNKHKTPNNSKFYAISLDNEIKFNSEFNKEYGSGPNRNFFQFKNSKNMNGDITDYSVIEFIKKSLNKYDPDLITADGGFDPINENYHEQESYLLIFGEILTAISVQKKGGKFVCKFLDMYTDVSIKLLYIVSQFYNSVEIYKPFTSRQSNAERYIIATDFKYSKTEKDYIKNYNILKDLFIKCKSITLNNNIINDIFPSFKVPNNYKENIIKLNTQIATVQYKNIFNRIQYFKSSNLNNDQFIIYSTEQENATNFWIKTFIEKT